METRLKTESLMIGGMTCTSCQNRIEKKLRNTAGVRRADVSYAAGKADVVFDPQVVTLKEITLVIQKLHYEVLSDGRPGTEAKRAVGILIILLAVFMVFRHLGLTDVFRIFPTAETGMSYGMLFITGLLTSVHCVAMCGGINLSQCIPRGGAITPPNELRTRAVVYPALMYNAGRVASYTAAGFLVGALGSVFSFSYAFQAGLKMIAGIFMVIMGINMLGVFAWTRRFVPRAPRALTAEIDRRKSASASPLIVGLLNGLMPCGPLQAMQIYALSTGSPVEGALSMMLFAIGTVPLMFGLGALSSMLGGKFTRNVMTAGAAVVVLLGVSMLSQAWNLSGLGAAMPSVVANAPYASNGIVADEPSAPDGSAANEPSAPDGLAGNGDYAPGMRGAPPSAIAVTDGVQVVNSTLASGRYPAITVQPNIPVKWIIDAPQGSINGCNSRLRIPEYDIQHQFEVGENIIEFTPDREGEFLYSCWMGMIRGTITVAAAEGGD
ncbi:MAG: sulfite exporter TauE/SafE family protein [Clostridiales Family XIII bacterium]|jgi:sulfite exporter TauE/SafE/copper chaperone CopZ|nr:sulfite exporter TauE/SafE family protein [Clostridiales Family XIII bacterium]